MNDVNPFRRLRAVPDEQAASPDALLAAASRGDEAAFGDLYDALAGIVHGVVLRVVRDPAMAQEVTQEVFVELWRLAPRFDASRGSASGWASTIAHRRAVDRVRSEQARRSREEIDASRRTAPYDEVSEAVEDHDDRSLVRTTALKDEEGGAWKAPVCKSIPWVHFATISFRKRWATRDASDPLGEPGNERFRSRRSGK